ncbi:MAG: cell envelope integrity protein TolA [Gammaproteobacteria bacterium]|nr:cell envelope integrity protein TolA [Gammaproteobacteria bacterium]
MAETLRFQNEFLREHGVVLTVSALLHLALLVLLALNLDLLPRTPPQPARLAIQATVIDSRAERQRAAEALQRARLAEQAEQQRREREDARREAEARRLADQRRQAEQERQAQAQAREREAAQRRADAQQKARAQEKAEAEARAEASAEASARAQADAQAAAKAKAEAEARARAEKRRAQSQADLARQMAEEEALAAVAGSPAAAEYRDIIAQKVRRNWNQPPSARTGDSCEVRVQQIPGGEVTSAVAFNCTGDAAFARSVEAAVLRASPLPLPSDPRLFDRNLLFTFKPEQ